MGRTGVLFSYSFDLVRPNGERDEDEYVRFTWAYTEKANSHAPGQDGKKAKSLGRLLKDIIM